MSPDTTSSPAAATPGTLLMVLALTLAAATTLLATAAAHATCALTGCTISAAPAHALPSLLLGHAPATAWQAPTMPGWAFWTLLLLLTTATTTLAALAARRLLRHHRSGRLRPAGGHGLATPSDVRRYYSAKAVQKMPWLRPDLDHPQAHDMGVMIGTTPAGDVWIPCEDSVAASSPSRQGKTRYLVTPTILAWPGPVVTTSLRAEPVTNTATARARTGPVAVFAPKGDDDPTLGTMRWSLTTGCDQPATALRRARALVANAATGTENSDFWKANAHSALASLLHAAALAATPLDTLAAWCTSPGQARAATTVLATTPTSPVAATWATQLRAQLDGDTRTTANIWATITSCVGLPLMDPAVRQALTPDPDHPPLDIHDLLTRSGTLYVIGDATATSAPVVAALIEEVWATATRTANTSPHNRLTPPLALVLDELNNIATLPSLPTMVSAGGGSNIMTMVVEQSRAQSESRWGTPTAAAIWDSATTKILLGGITREQTLTEVSAAMGERTVHRRTTSLTATGHTTLAEHREPVLTRGDIHDIPRGHALIIKAGAPAAVITLLPHQDRHHHNNSTSRRTSRR